MSALAIQGGSPSCTRIFPKYPYYGEDVEAAALRVIRSGALSAEFGDEVETFEEAFARYHGVEHAVAVNCGTSALQLALQAAGVGVGDEVIVPPYTFIATASAVVACNAIPVFADIEPESFGLDPREVLGRLSPRTRAIIPVHMNGYPCDMQALLEIAERHQLAVIEDCSHAHGATHGGRKVGTLGDFGAFSLQHKKNLSLGEGGMVLARSAAHAERLRKLRSFGQGVIPGNYRMPELHAAVGGVQLTKLSEMNSIRCENAKILGRLIQGVRGLEPLRVRSDCEAVYYNFILRYDGEAMGISRDRFLEALHAEGIPVKMFYRPLHGHPLFLNRDAFGQGCPFACPRYTGSVNYGAESYPVTEAVCSSSTLEIKVHPPCGQIEMEEVGRAIRKVADLVGERGTIRRTMAR